MKQKPERKERLRGKKRVERSEEKEIRRKKSIDEAIEEKEKKGRMNKK